MLCLRSFLHLGFHYLTKCAYSTSKGKISLFCHLSHSILAEAKNLSFNATAAFKAYSNIKANVDAAEKEAKAAKQRASEALALVSGHGYKHTKKTHAHTY